MPCILPENIKDLRHAIVENGGYVKLRNMTAAERVEFFSRYVDAPGMKNTAEWLNREIERRVLQPGQNQAVQDWIKRIEKKKLKITNKKALLERVLDKKEVFSPKGFYAEGLAKQALGFETGREETKQLFEKAKTVDEYRKKLLSVAPDYLNYTSEQLKKLTPEQEQARIALGEKLVEFQRLYESINLQAQAAEYQTKGWWGRRGEDILKIAGNIKSVKASFDLSFLRQLQSTAYVNKSSFADAMKTGYTAFFDRTKVDTILGDLLTRPNALAGRYNDFGVEVGIKEEAFPESWVSKMMDKGGLEWWNAFARSENAFNAAIQTARADLFDWMWERSGGDVKLLKTQEVGKAINTVTGRGQFPILTSNDPKQNRIINNLLFAPKWLASRIQAITDIRYAGHLLDLSPKGVRARAAVGNAIMIGMLMSLKSVLWATDDDDDRTFGSVLDPKSADFGKIIIGRTRFDLTAGTGSLITLIFRMGTLETRTSQDQVRPVKMQDLLGNWLKGKSSPGIQVASKVIQFAKTGELVDWRGKPVPWETPADYAENIAELLAPISITTGIQAGRDIAQAEGHMTEEEWAQVFGLLADIIGVGSNTYDKK